MGCNCGQKRVGTTLGWTVDLGDTGKTFVDGSTKKVFVTVGEANIAVARLSLNGKVRPRPATTADKA